MSVLSRLRNLFTGRPDRITSSIQLVTETGSGQYYWRGKIFQSDIVRACIRPKTQAIGKIVGKHIRQTVARDGAKSMAVNPEPYIKYLLEEPNPYMSGQMLQEKMANQLALNGNAFAYIQRDANGFPAAIWPISAVQADAQYSKNGDLFLTFTLQNGKVYTFAYSDVLHLRRDFNEHDVFGTSQFDALKPLMECIGTLDSGIINAIKSSGIIRWLMKLPSSTRREDVRKQAKQFAEDYLSTESDSLGVAGVSANAEVEQIKPTDIMPNKALMDAQVQRVYAFFGTNDDIVMSKFTDDEWNSYYENEIEPVVVQFSNEWTRKLFTRRERGCGNKIVFESVNLQCASINTKLNLVQFFDRGIMSRNEIREAMNMAPVEGGDDYYVRLDTGKVTEEGGE